MAERFDAVIARADRVMASLDERGSGVRAAAKRERQRLNSDLYRRFARVGVALAVISLAVIVIGLVTPIGMFGFLAAVGLSPKHFVRVVRLPRVWFQATNHDPQSRAELAVANGYPDQAHLVSEFPDIGARPPTHQFNPAW